MGTTRRSQKLRIPLDRDGFLRDILRVLSGTLQDVIGLEEASGFVSVVGQSIGEQLNALYRSAYEVERLDRGQVSEALVDLKRRIQGGFRVVDEDESRITLENHACPFGDHVRDRPSLCMMTSNVFGTITAENLGYARVVLEETIADGAPKCRILVHLDDQRERDADGREYFGS